MKLKQKVEQWFIDRDLDKAEPSKQFLKLIEETGELFEGIAKNDEALIKDAIGDIQVVLIGLEMQLENQEEQKALSDLEGDLLVFVNVLGMYAGNLARPDSEKAELGFVLARGFIPILIDKIAQSFNTTPDECLGIAYNEIKDRKGKLINGVFVKEEDL